MFRRRSTTVIDSIVGDTGRTNTKPSSQAPRASRGQRSATLAPPTEVGTQGPSGSGGVSTENREWINRPNEVLPPADSLMVSLVATQNHITARIELTPEQAHALDVAVADAEHVTNPSRSPWVGVIIRTSRGRYVLRRGFCWTGVGDAIDARGVLAVLRHAVPLELRAEVGRHLYAPLVGDSTQLNEYLW